MKPRRRIVNPSGVAGHPRATPPAFERNHLHRCAAQTAPRPSAESHRSQAIQRIIPFSCPATRKKESRPLCGLQAAFGSQLTDSRRLHSFTISLLHSFTASLLNLFTPHSFTRSLASAITLSHGPSPLRRHHTRASSATSARGTRAFHRNHPCPPSPPFPPLKKRATFTPTPRSKRLLLPLCPDHLVLADDSGLEVDALNGEPASAPPASPPTPPGRFARRQ